MKNIVFIGTNFFASNILEKMIKKKINIICIITKENKKMGRGQKKGPHPVKNIATKYNINCLTIDNINKNQDEIKKINPNLIVVVEYFKKLSTDIINIPLHGIINVHPSLLPNLKGPTPIQSAIIHNLEETGVSIIKINDKYDCGEIIGRSTCKIKHNDTYFSLSKKLNNLAFNLLKQTIDKIKYGRCKTKIQEEKNVIKTYKIKKEFYKINWMDSADFINRKIRSTFNIAKHHAIIEGNYINIIETKIIKNINKNYFVPGTITKVSKLGIDVITNNGIIRIKKIQFSGKKINSIKNVLNSKSYLFKIGNQFK